jgi:putative ABC transport system permease protein
MTRVHRNGSGGLPRVVEWMIRVGVPVDQQEPIAGDLQEEYADRLRRAGAVRATAALCWAAARLTAAFRWELLVHGRGLPPIGDEIRQRRSILESLWRDAGFGVRTLGRQPGFTLVALAALALGVGANSAIFSVVDAALWRPLPYPDADRVVSVAEQRPREGRWFGPVAPADFFDWRHDAKSFEAFAAYLDVPLNLSNAGEPERLRGLTVTPGFFAAVGIRPAQGREFLPEEESVGRHRVVLLTDGLWRRRFGGDANVIGRALTLDGNPYEVIGILPSTFWWRSHPDIVVPLALTDHDKGLRAAHFLDTVARLRPDAGLGQAREELKVIGARLATKYPAENRNHAPSMRLLRDALVGDVRVALLVLLAAVGFVLLIACANVATLLLARAASRQKELAIRRAVGATRGRLVQQMLTESLLISVSGCAAGLLVGEWILAAFRAILPAQFSQLPGVEFATIDVRVLAAAAGISATTGVLIGIVPAIIASDQRVGPALNEQSRGSSGSVRAERTRSALIVAEVALSLMLLAGAALLIVSFKRLMDVPSGLHPDEAVAARVTLPASRYDTYADAAGFFDNLLDRLRALPGVEHAAATTALPFTTEGEARLDLNVERRTIESTLPVRAHPRLVSTDYFVTVGIPLLRGRQLTRFDDGSVPVALINDAASRRYWPDQNPLGQRISLGAPAGWMEIVGVVGDVRHEGLDVEAEPEVYIPHAQEFTAMGDAAYRSRTIVVRTALAEQAVAAMVRASVAAIDPQQPVGWVRSVDALIAESVAPRRLNLWLVTAFAILALVLTAGGLYGVMAYLVTARTREIGVRIALGASPSSVVRLVLGRASVLTLLGIGTGIAGALAVSRAVAGLLFGVSATEPWVFVAASLLLGVVSLAAAAVPSWRAVRIDPIAALRDG